MCQLLINQPKHYIYKYVGENNREEYEKALEIFLAEKTLFPEFPLNITNNMEFDKKYYREIKEYKKEYPTHTYNDDLIMIYYFHFLKYSDQGYMSEYEQDQWEKFVGYSLLWKRYINDLFKNSITYLLFRLNLNAYNNYIKQKDSLDKLVYNANIDDQSNVDLKNKFLGIMMMQNHQIYSLKMDCIEQTEEFEVFERFRDEFTIANFEVRYSEGDTSYEIK